MQDEHINSSEDRMIWRSLLAGVVVWFSHLNIVNALTSLTCNWGWFPFTIAGIAGLRFIHIIVSLIAGVVIAVIIAIAWRDWRSLQVNAQEGTLQATESDRRPLIAFVTMILNGLFLLYVLASLAMVTTLNLCA